MATISKVDSSTTITTPSALPPTRPTAPWTQVVRGESEPSSPLSPSASAAVIEQVLPSSSASSPSPVAEESLENGTGSAGNAGKKAAWNKPSNGAAFPEVIGVMGAESWPALSESARVSSKSNPDFVKGLSDGSSSMSSSQGIGTLSSATPNLRHGSDNANANSTPNHGIPSRQRSMKRNGANTSANGGTQPLPGSHGPSGEAYLNNSSPRDHPQRSSQPRGANDHPQQQRSFRNRSGGRGEGSQHHNYGGRRDHDRANHDWNNRNFNGRDAHMQSQRGVPRFVRHPPPPPSPTSTPFMVPPPVRPVGTPIGYPEFSMYYFSPPPDSLRALTFYPPPVPQVFVPAADLQLHSKIVNQIDYYFSNENLVKDIFLRKNMDDQGWVPVKLIAGFKKVLYLTDNIQLILDALRSSAVVEIQGDRVRRRTDWQKWIMPPSVQFPNAAGPGNSSHVMLADNMQNVSLEENTIDRSNARSQVDPRPEEFVGQSSSGDLTMQSVKEEMGPVNGAGDFSHSSAARSSS